MDKQMVHENDEIEIDLLQLLMAIRKKIWLVLMVGLAGACIMLGYTKFLVVPQYESTSMMLVLTKETTLSSLADLQMGSQLTKDYTLLINSRPVLEEVIDNLDLQIHYKTLKNCIKVENPDSSRMLRLTVTQSDPYLAKAVADELAHVSSAYIGDQMEVVPPKIIEEGEFPVSKVSPSMTKNGIIGLLLGAFLVCGVICVMEIMNDAIQTEEDITRYLGGPVLAIVPDVAGMNEKETKKQKSKNLKNKGKDK